MRMGKKTSTRIILKPSIFQDFFGSSHNWFGCTLCGSPSSAQWQLQTCLWQWSGRPPTGLPWCCPGIARGQPAPTSLSEWEKSLQTQYLANRASIGSSLCLRYPLQSWTGAVVYGNQSMYKSDLFGLKIGRDSTRVFLMKASLMVCHCIS